MTDSASIYSTQIERHLEQVLYDTDEAGLPLVHDEHLCTVASSIRNEQHSTIVTPVSGSDRCLFDSGVLILLFHPFNVRFLGWWSSILEKR